jgi:hypothetical protein
MSHAKELRDTSRAVLAGMARFSGFVPLRTWARDIDEAELPSWCVATPRVRQNKDAARKYSVEPDLEIQLRRAGGDSLEDDLDADADAIEAALLPALEAISEAPEMVLIETSFHNAGERRVGFLNMRFSARKLIAKTL